MANLRPPTIDPSAALRWQGLPVDESPWLHEEVARRMQERLDLIKRRPQSWLHWEPLRGGLAAHKLLVKRYPDAACTVLESSQPKVDQTRRALHGPWWRWQQRGKLDGLVAQQIPQPVDMLWANMNLHMSAEPQAVIAQWHKALHIDGFLMFSCLGPDTLKELHVIYQQLGWPAPSHTFTDMHDWGDMLVEAGFAEPVMDMEHITLTFETPARLLLELRGLGRNLHVDRFTGLRGRDWHTQLMDALGRLPLQLNFEVIYGHAFKPEPRVKVNSQSEISLQDMRAALGGFRRGGVKQGAGGRHD
jgi:malonyl-CoA O-methyltransferase